MATEFMGMTLPVVGPAGTAGTTYATYLVESLETIDEHDHSTGKGTKVTPAGLNINAALDMNEWALTDVARLGMFSTASTLSVVNSIYVKSGQLYFVDSAGNQVQLTAGGGINLSSVGSIGGDFSTSTAAVTYSDVSKAFTFTQDAGITADIAAGSLFIYENVASAKYTKIKNAASQASNQTITLPSALPVSTRVVSLSSTGVLATAVAGAIIAADLGTSAVETLKINDLAVTTAKINDLAVTRGKLATLTPAVSSSSGSVSTTSASMVDVTNLSVSVTVTGRPIWVGLVSDGSANSSYIGGRATSDQRIAFGDFRVLRDATEVSRVQINAYFQGIASGSNTAELYLPPGALFHLDIGVAAGTYTYKVQYMADGGRAAVNYCKLVAYEIG